MTEDSTARVPVTAADILSKMETAPEPYELADGTVLQISGLRSFRVQARLLEDLETYSALRESSTLTIDGEQIVYSDVELYTIVLATYGIVSPKFTFREAATFLERDGAAFAGVVLRIKQLSEDILAKMAKAKGAEVAADPFPVDGAESGAQDADAAG